MVMKLTAGMVRGGKARELVVPASTRMKKSGLPWEVHSPFFNS